MQNPGFEYYGDTCECNNFKCGKDEKGKICSGECVCVGMGVCVEVCVCVGVYASVCVSRS